jgi:hypothetical protein
MIHASRSENFAARYALRDQRERQSRRRSCSVLPILKSHLATLAPGYTETGAAICPQSGF